MTTTHEITISLLTHAIDPARLDVVRRNGTDGHGNDLYAFPATGKGEPLRCCLRMAREGESIALISFAPFAQASPWTEVGPVYVHADRCAGHDACYRPARRAADRAATAAHLPRGRHHEL